MKRIGIAFCLLFLVACTDNNRGIDRSTDEKPLTEAEFRKKVGKRYIKNDTLYFDKSFSKDEPMKLRMFDSIGDSIKNQDEGGTIRYKGQLVKEIVHIFKYRDGLQRVIFLSNEKGDTKTKVFVSYIYYNNKTKKLSEPLSSSEPIKLEKHRPLSTDTQRESLFVMKSNNLFSITGDYEPNQYFGYTTELAKLRTLKIEGKKPDGIKEFKVNGIKYYFWYYNDLETKKETNEYIVEFNGKNKSDD